MDEDGYVLYRNKISPEEQAIFIEKLLANTLPVSEHAQTMTKNILFVEELKNGWKLYGKTGMGNLLNADETKNPDLYHGWFIGWISKGDVKIIFVNHITDSKKEETFASLRAKADAKEKLTKIIDKQEGSK
jgi:beta-lactamase class D